jgi:hypothetical protein
MKRTTILTVFVLAVASINAYASTTSNGPNGSKRSVQGALTTPSSGETNIAFATPPNGETNIAFATPPNGETNIAFATPPNGETNIAFATPPNGETNLV